MVESIEEATMDCLINTGSRSWNSEMVEEILFQVKQKKKKKKPSRVAVADSLFWPMSKDGQYSCKSRYNFLKEDEDLNFHEEPPDEEQRLWKGIWALSSPNKGKILICRACRNSLPTKRNLVCRTIINNPNCDHYSLSPERVLHAVWTCTELDAVWSDAVLWGF